MFKSSRLGILLIVVVSALGLTGFALASPAVPAGGGGSEPQATPPPLPTLPPPYPVRAYLPLIAGGQIVRDPNWGLSGLAYVVAGDPAVVTATVTVVNSSGQAQPAMSVACGFFPASVLKVLPPQDDTSGFLPGWKRDFATGETQVFTFTLHLSWHPVGEPDLAGTCFISNLERHFLYSFENVWSAPAGLAQPADPSGRRELASAF